MDGPTFRTGRTLTIEFKTDRNSQERLVLAFRRIETVDSVLEPSKKRLELGLVDQVVTPHLTLEIHG